MYKGLKYLSGRMMKCSLSVKVNNNGVKRTSLFYVNDLVTGQLSRKQFFKVLDGLSDNWYESFKALKHHGFYTFHVLHPLCLCAF